MFWFLFTTTAPASSLVLRYVNLVFKLMLCWCVLLYFVGFPGHLRQISGQFKPCVILFHKKLKSLPNNRLISFGV